MLDNDSVNGGNKPDSVVSVTDPPCGDVQIETDGTITFVPNQDFFGLCIFTYEICNSSTACDTALVTVTVSPGFNPWYPDWSPGGDGCLNDGGEVRPWADCSQYSCFKHFFNCSFDVQFFSGISYSCRT